MFPTTQATHQVVSIFGGNYISEQHNDATLRRFPRSDERPFAVDFDKLLKTLRSALFVRRQQSA
jgi:hypothetical protein